MSPTNSVPGLVLPKVQAPLAGSPGASAMAARNNQAQQQAALANAVGGRRRRVKMGANKMGANKMAERETRICLLRLRKMWQRLGRSPKSRNFTAR